MSEQTTTRRAPGRPKKTTTTPKAEAKKPLFKHKEVVNTNTEYELVGKGGIVTMLPQKGGKKPVSEKSLGDHENSNPFSKVQRKQS